MQRNFLNRSQHVPGHETGASTFSGTQPGPIVPRAVLQHVSGYETQGNVLRRVLDRQRNDNILPRDGMKPERRDQNISAMSGGIKA